MLTRSTARKSLSGGFTLIELLLLVVIAIIAALLLPVPSRA
jgi:type II secretory pathway pseudopilin PulG